MSESEQRTGNLPTAPVTGPLGGDKEEEPPSTPRRLPLWQDVPDHNWDDWHWQSQNAIRSVRQLRDLLPFAPDELEVMGRLEGEYKLAIPPYYFSLINPDDPNDPIRLQSVTSPLEAENPSGFELEDPLEEDKDAPVPGLTHRYPDRALLVTTHVCTMYCRFCTRKRATMVRGGWDAINRNDERMIEYVRDHPEIRDVIVSGGDPLTLPMNKLKFFVDNLAKIRHVDVIRIGTRVPVTLPQRLYDQELIDLLGSAGKVWIQTHFNHPREITPEAARVCNSLLRAGMPVNNHIVLLKGVNDSLETMRDLCRALLRIKVRPYYLFHCDPVIGAGHFRTSVWKGMEIMEGLRGHMSGLGIPTYVVDSPHGGGKIPLMPNYLVSASDDAVVLRNFEGMLVRYQAEDKPVTVKKTRTRGVSSLLQGTESAIIPQNNERMARRKLHVVSEANEHEAVNGNGCCGGSTPEHTDLPALASDLDGDDVRHHNGHANGHGRPNGHANGDGDADSLIPLMLVEETISG
jgi:lysine 2,3-aminomutase